jgi:hypothetical protein
VCAFWSRGVAFGPGFREIAANPLYLEKAVIIQGVSMTCELLSSGADEMVSLVHEARSQAHGLFAIAKLCIQKEKGELRGIFPWCHLDSASWHEKNETLACVYL